MPISPPSPAIQPPAALAATRAQPMRSERVFDPIAQQPVRFKTTLDEASRAESRADAPAPEASDQETAVKEVRIDEVESDAQPVKDEQAGGVDQDPPQVDEKTDVEDAPPNDDPAAQDEAVVGTGTPTNERTQPRNAPSQSDAAHRDAAAEPAKPAPVEQGVQATDGDRTHTNDKRRDLVDEAAQSRQADAKASPVALTPHPVSPNAQNATADPASDADAEPAQVDAAQIDDQASGNSGQDTGGQASQQRPGSDPSAPLPESAATASAAERSAAQPLRPMSAEPALTQTDPASVETAAVKPGASVQGARPSGAAAPSLGTVEPDAAFQVAVQRGMAAAVRQKGGTLTIKLDPPSLGKMTIRMTIDQGRVQASFDAQTAAARDLLIEHMPTLRAQLRDRGLTVERLDVLGAQSPSGAGRATAHSAAGEQPGAQGDPWEDGQDAAGGQSRGRSETGDDEPSRDDGASGESAGSAEEPMTTAFEARLRHRVSAVV